MTVKTHFGLQRGLYPQEFILQLASTSQLQRIAVSSTNARTIELEKSSQPTPQKWESIGTIQMADMDGRIQEETVNLSTQDTDANFIKVRIAKGWDDFTSIHKLIVEGNKV